MDTRQNIVQTASSLFYSQGYNSTGINEIIAESGIAKATLYSHFRSKEDICLAYLQFKNETFLEDVSAFCKNKRAGKNRVLAIFDFLQKFFKSKDFNGCWCIRTVAEIPRENTRIRQEIQKQKNAFLALIDELVRETQVEKTASKKLSRQIYLLYESAVAESHLHQDDWPIKEAKNICSIILK